jgi:IS1 family transposase
LDITTRQVIACHVGGRLIKDAKALWDLVPEVYKNDANFYTDQLEAYREAIPEELHYPCKKKWSNKFDRKTQLYSKAVCESTS